MMWKWRTVVVLAAVCGASPAHVAGFDPEPARATGIPELAVRWPGGEDADAPGYERVRFGDGSLGVIVPLEAPQGLVPGMQRSLATVAGLMAIFEAALPDGIGEIALEGPGSFGFREAREGERVRRQPAGVPAFSFKYVSGRIESAGNPKPVVQVQRTWFSVFEPADPEKARGSILLMPGLFGTPEPILNTMTGRLRDEGWTVVRMMAQPSRFTEQMHWEIDLDGENRAAGLGAIVRETTDRVAECAYASKAAMEFVVEQRPALAELPRMAIGMSGGAMTLPTVLALDVERYAGAIMIAGGADFFTMNIQSNYRQMIDAVRCTWNPGPPDDGQLEALSREYLSMAPLDSYHTARALRGRPMLMIHGMYDMAVPAPLGDLLWEQLGRPERWIEEGGHEEVFMRLPRRMDEIVAWLDHQVSPE